MAKFLFRFAGIHDANLNLSACIDYFITNSYQVIIVRICIFSINLYIYLLGLISHLSLFKSLVPFAFQSSRIRIEKQPSITCGHFVTRFLLEICAYTVHLSGITDLRSLSLFLEEIRYVFIILNLKIFYLKSSESLFSHRI